MKVFSSDSSISAAAPGRDWREATRAVLAALETKLEGDHGYNLGFIYLTDKLADETGNILGLLRSVTRVEKWVGTAGVGVIGMEGALIDQPALSVMLMRQDDPESFRPFAIGAPGASDPTGGLEEWLEENEPMLCLVHGDAELLSDPAPALRQLDQMVGGFLAGGFCSARSAGLQIAGDLQEAGLAGVVFSQAVPVSIGLTQGCSPLGPAHTVTRCEDHVVMELDGQRAFDVFAADIRKTVSGPAGLTDQAGLERDIDELLEGEVHAAFPVSGTDQRDYLVRNIVGIDPDTGWISVAHDTANGERMLFVRRDNDTVRSDLTRMVLDIRKRVTAERGSFAPSAALYFSCVARATSELSSGEGSEIDILHEILGDIPLTGFYANGEVCNGRLYGYTGILILFL